MIDLRLHSYGKGLVLTHELKQEAGLTPEELDFVPEPHKLFVDVEGLMIATARCSVTLPVRHTGQVRPRVVCTELLFY